MRNSRRGRRSQSPTLSTPRTLDEDFPDIDQGTPLSILVTIYKREFSRVPGLTIENWCLPPQAQHTSLNPLHLAAEGL